MDKRDIFDALDNFSQNLMMTLAEVEAIKKHLQDLVAENTNLRLENDKLRERLGQVETQTSGKPQGHVDNLERIYDDGFHVCNVFYGQRRANDDPCAFCIELLYRD